MKLYTLKEKKLSGIPGKPFNLEKEIQEVVENNLKELFGLQMVKSEFRIKNFRIDTLTFNPESKSFIVIEYKKDRNYSVIDQGYTYLSVMLNNKADFILEYNERCEKSLKKDDVDWSQSRVIFISPQFTEYQKNSVNFRDVPFELWEIKRYENTMIGLLQHKTTSEESINTVNIGRNETIEIVGREVQVYNEEYHLNRTKNRLPWVNDYYLTLSLRMQELGDDVNVVYRGNYISFRKKNPFADVILYQKGLYIVINMKKGNLKDPDNLTKDFSVGGHWGNGDYQVLIDNKSVDLDSVMYLVKQSYQHQD